MRKNIKLLLVASLMLMVQTGYGQISLPKIDFSLGFGGSSPVGAFAGSDVQGSLVASENFPDFAEGISKRDNGFANLGFQYHARLGFKLLGIKMSLLAENAHHRLKDDVLSEHLTNRFSAPYEYVQDNYKRNAFMVGIGKELSLFGFEAEISFLAGTSTLNFPNFTYNHLNSEFQITRYAAEISDINAFTYGADVRVQYPIEDLFSVGVFMNYQTANYDYFYDLIGTPGGSSLNEFDDTVSYRKLDLGVFVSIDIL